MAVRDNKQVVFDNSKVSEAITNKIVIKDHPCPCEIPHFTSTLVFSANVPHDCPGSCNYTEQPLRQNRVSIVLGSLLCAPQKLMLASKLSSCLVARLRHTFQLPLAWPHKAPAHKILRKSSRIAILQIAS